MNTTDLFCNLSQGVIVVVPSFYSSNKGKNVKQGSIKRTFLCTGRDERGDKGYVELSTGKVMHFSRFAPIDVIGWEDITLHENFRAWEWEKRNL